jgi:hypothetical protein
LKGALVGEDRLYILTLEWHGMTKRLFVSGPDGDEGKAALKQAVMALDEVGDSAQSFEEFYSGAVQLYKQHGFLWVDK